jgi:hypothetical protein
VSTFKYEFVPYESLPEDNYYREDGARPFAVRVIAAKLWSEALNTSGTNGDFMHSLLNTMVAESRAEKYSDTQRAAFAKSMIDNGGKLLRYESSWKPGEMVASRIDGPDVDYGPNPELLALVLAAGIGQDDVAWPMKHRSSLETDHFRCGFGYRQPAQHHYPLPDGRVLVSQQRFDVDGLVAWVSERMPAPGCEWADWTWKEYARSLGYEVP